MKKETVKSTIILSLLWKFMERGGTQIVQFIVQLILARLLSPQEYGIIAIVNVFIVLASVFVQSGLNTALIQKKDADELDFSSIFYFGLIVAGVLYTVLFITSPHIASIYNNSQLVPVIKVLGIVLFFGAINSIQNAFIARNMMFKKLFYSSLVAIFISGMIGLVTAFRGYGIWALVAQQISNQFFVTVTLWITVKWRPKLMFSFKRVKLLFSYGSKILASSLLNTLYTNLRTLIIGNVYNSDMIGYYSRGMQFPQLIVNNINGSIQSVMLPALAVHQDNPEKMKTMVKRSIMTSSFVIFPMMIGLAVIAEPLIIFLLTEKWLPSIPFLQIYCAVFVLKPIYTANLQAINALGRSDIFLRLETISTVIGVVILLATLPFGVLSIAVGSLISGILSLIVYLKPSETFIQYGLKEQVVDVMPALILSLVMGSSIYYLKFLNIHIGLILLLQVIMGIVIYFTLAKILKIESYTYLVDTFINMGFNNRVKDMLSKNR